MISKFLESPTTRSCMQGLKIGGLMNQSIDAEEAFKQGRHHVMTTVNQIIEWDLALEQVSRCLNASHLIYPLKTLHIFKYIIPAGVSFLASRQIDRFKTSQIADFVQDHIGKMSLIITVVSTVALFVLGQTVLAATSLTYLTLGLLDRNNRLPSTVQKVMVPAHFIIGNLTGMYLGGNFIRFISVMNVVIAGIQKFFTYQIELNKKRNQGGKRNHVVNTNDTIPKVNSTVSLREIRQQSIPYKMDESHIHQNSLRPISDSVKVDDILTLSQQIDWSKHEHVIAKHLEKDARWQQVGKYKNIKPVNYFKENLTELIESIKYRRIMQGKPQNYDMLEYYSRFIAQELKNQDVMTQADSLILLGIEGGKYCGAGKFGIIEEVYENLSSQAAGLPLKSRVLSCLQMQRTSNWQSIYEMIWNSNPLCQIFGYMTDTHAVHNSNLFINLVQAGTKFGIPHQAAKNDQTATINPITHYMAFSFVELVERTFWKGGRVPQLYFSIDKSKTPSWKFWKWIHLNKKSVKAQKYDEIAILERLKVSIGTTQIPKSDIYEWWTNWITRQQDLSDIQKSDLMDEILMGAALNGEALEENGKIKEKFLVAMLIEMGIFKKT